MKEKIRYRVVPGRWRYWSHDNPHTYEPPGGVGFGIGRGEERVSWEIEHSLGRKCKVMGGSYPYDILEDSGQKWEVKEPNDRLNIRLGSAGIRAALPLIERARLTIESLQSVLSDISVRSGDTILLLGKHPLVEIRKTLQNDLESVQKGEVSRGLVFGGTSAHSLGLLSICGILYEHFDGQDETSRMIVDLVKQELQETWDSVEVPSKTLDEVSGIILVDPKEGYVFIPISEVDKHLVFERVTQGKALYRIKEVGSEPESSYIPPVQLSFDFDGK